ncbi:MAG: STAS domain-containing protein [Mangrovicoccus sp.]
MPVEIPILKMGATLIASIQEELSDNDILDLQNRILNMVIKTRSQGVVIDVSALQVLDSFGTRTLIDISSAVKLRGARMVIVGIQPEVALSMVLLGLTLEGVPTACDLEAGTQLLDRLLK